MSTEFDEVAYKQRLTEDRRERVEALEFPALLEAFDVLIEKEKAYAAACAAVASERETYAAKLARFLGVFVGARVFNTTKGYGQKMQTREYEVSGFAADSFDQSKLCVNARACLKGGGLGAAHDLRTNWTLVRPEMLKEVPVGTRVVIDGVWYEFAGDNQVVVLDADTPHDPGTQLPMAPETKIEQYELRG